ncbi:MAG: S41 family peptidase [Deltaproteobacteria bacterium]|nr:S41 family peptidase [Deltaproteobacteria bacterium]
MASKGKRWLGEARLVGAAFLGGAVAARASDATSEREVPYAPLSQLARVLVQVEHRYVDPVDRQRLLEGAIKGMVAELDPHSAFLPPREFAQFNEDTGGAFGGIGVEVDFRRQRVLVLAPIPDSPAARAGIRSGDELLAVDGKPLAGMPAEAIVRAMRGAPGSRVSLTLKKKDATEPTTLELVRAEVHVRSVEGKRLTGNVGYVRLRQFQADTHREWLATLATLRRPDEPPLVGIVLDLRNNPGGLVDQAEAVADELLEGGSIYSMRHRGKVVEEARAHRGGTLTDLPVVALVNEYSASSSELLVGALKDARRATVVGAPTFGKGSVQTIYELPGSSGLRLTTMRYYTPSGRPIQARGVQPDVLVRYDDDAQSALPVVREGDLDGALEQEAGAPDEAPPSEVVTGKKRPEILTLDDVPTDPTRSDDVALLAALRRLAAAR